MLKLAGISFTPQDGSKHLRPMVKKVCESNGGEGAVREMIETLFEINDEMDRFLALWQ
jgi:3-deoxy-D-manno-octulosonate 8-phosphate phosphatase (KDO 8-P phosphatase)